MKKLFLTLGLLGFLGGGYYLQQNYTFVQLDSEQLAQVGSSTLQSSVFSGSTEEAPYKSDVLIRIGSFAIVRNSSELVTEEKNTPDDITSESGVNLESSILKLDAQLEAESR